MTSKKYKYKVICIWYIYSRKFFKNEPTQPTQPTQGKIRWFHGENWWRHVGWLNSPPKMSLQVVGWSTHTPKPTQNERTHLTPHAHEEYDGLVFFDSGKSRDRGIESKSDHIESRGIQRELAWHPRGINLSDFRSSAGFGLVFFRDGANHVTAE